MKCPICHVLADQDATSCPQGHPLDPPQKRKALRLRCSVEAKPYLVLTLRNLLFTLLTFGIYRFWGRVNERRYLYGVTSFAGATFAFHGRGKDLFLGFLKFIGLFLVFGVAIGMHEEMTGIKGIRNITLPLVGILLTPVILVGANRYRLANTSWRGIRFSFRGTVRGLVPKYFLWALMIGLSLGLAIPYFQNEYRRYVIEHTCFGNQVFGYTASARKMYPPFLVAILLLGPTFGLSWFYYTAKRDRLQWEHTQFGEGKFRLRATTAQIVKLHITNFLINLFTLKLGRPWVVVRTMRFFSEHLRLTGPVDLRQIVQEFQAATASGEALGDMGLGDGIDLGLGV